MENFENEEEIDTLTLQEMFKAETGLDAEHDKYLCYNNEYVDWLSDKVVDMMNNNILVKNDIGFLSLIQNIDGSILANSGIFPKKENVIEPEYSYVFSKTEIIKMFFEFIIQKYKENPLYDGDAYFGEPEE